MRHKGEKVLSYVSRYPMHEVDPLDEDGDTDRWKVKMGYSLAETWSLTPYNRTESLTGEPLKPCNPMGLLDEHRGYNEIQRYCKWEEGPFQNEMWRNVCVALPPDYKGHQGEWDWEIARKYARDPESSTECMGADTWAMFLYKHLRDPIEFPSAPEIVCDSTSVELRQYFEEGCRFRALAVEALDYIDQACGRHGVPPPEPAKMKFERSLGRRRRSEPVDPPFPGESLLNPSALRKKTDLLSVGLPNTEDYWPFDEYGNPNPRLYNNPFMKDNRSFISEPLDPRHGPWESLLKPWALRKKPDPLQMDGLPGIVINTQDYLPLDEYGNPDPRLYNNPFMKGRFPNAKKDGPFQSGPFTS